MESESAIKTIVVALVIALIAGGSAPWWWGKLFPPSEPSANNGNFTASPTPSREPSPENKSIPATPTPTARRGIGACADGDSPNTAFHDTAAANGSWDWDCNGQVEREFGVCENLTREQCDPHTNATGAPPGFCSEIRSEGGCPPKVAECRKSGYVYPCFYNAQDGRCHAGGYETAQVMRCR